MDLWNPGRIWQGEDAYVIGGGPSLHGFDWEFLRGRNTVGCNSAFILGAHYVKITLFGDLRWWVKIGCERLGEYGGIVVGCMQNPIKRPPPWLCHMGRYTEDRGLAPPGCGMLAWPDNTGGAAINLALAAGARRVFLLGFDMAMAPRPDSAGQLKPNFHDLRHEPGAAEVYCRFKSRTTQVFKNMQEVYPGCEVVNVSDVSTLETFPKQSISEHFRKVAS